MRRIAFGVFALFCALHLSAAPKKPELAPQYKRWIDQDVVYIVTDEERKSFLTLTTDAERDRFIDEFWAVRNPVRRSEKNAYKDEHYARIEYANAHFGKDGNTPGWKTDMGRAYILFGAPTSRHPFVGYSQIYPMELWFYDNNTNSPALPSFFYLLFYIDGDIGEYKFYRPFMDGPMKLVRGSQFNSNADVYKFIKPMGGDIAHAVLSLVPSEPIDTVNYQPEMGSDILVSKIQNFANDPFNVRKIREMRAIRTNVQSRLLVNDDTPLAIDSLVITDPIGQAWIDYSVLVRDASMGQVQTKPAQPGLPGSESKDLAVTSGFQLLTDKGEMIVENEEEQTFHPFGQDGLFHPFQLAGRLPVMPGSYTLEFRIVDRQKSRVYYGARKFTVAVQGTAGVGGPLFFGAAKQVAKPDGTAPFQYFGAQFLPLVGDEQLRTDPLRLLYSLEVPKQTSPDQPNEYSVEYVIADLLDRDARKIVKETIPQTEFRDGRLLKTKTIPVTDLPAGAYRVVVTVHAGTSETVLTSASAPIRLLDSSTPPTLYFLNSARSTATPAGASYIRGLEAIAAKDQPGAMRYMKLALDLDIANVSAARFLVQGYFESREYGTIASVYKKVGIKPFEGSAESLAQISLSFARTGDRKQAREILDNARALFPENNLLLATAKAVSN